MDDEEQVIPASEEEDTELDTENGDEEETQEESAEELKARLAKAEELANNYKIRAEKAEAKPKAPAKPAGEISSTDLYALIQANVPQDDITEVQEYAKLKKISIAEALKTNVVKTILADAAETRKTAEATSTGTARRVAPKVSTDTLLARASQGELPEDDGGLSNLIAARLEKKKAGDA